MNGILGLPGTRDGTQRALRQLRAVGFSSQNLTNPERARALANLGLVFAPQGRLTLTTATPIMTSAVTNGTTLFYTPSSAGNLIPLYDGSNFVPTIFPEISQLTTDTAKSPAAAGNSSVYDNFVWDDAGILRLSRGPAWTNDTTRSAGTELTVVNGLRLNSVDIVNGPRALRGTYVGTFRTNSIAQIVFGFGGTASGGSAITHYLWNMYNRAAFCGHTIDNQVAYGYGSATVRQAGGGAGNQANFVIGVAEDSVRFAYTARGQTGASAGDAFNFGVGFDVTNAYSVAPTVFQTSAAAATAHGGTNAGFWRQPAIGVHFLSACESSPSGTSSLNFGTANTLSVEFRA